MMLDKRQTLLAAHTIVTDIAAANIAITELLLRIAMVNDLTRETELWDTVAEQREVIQKCLVKLQTL